MQASRRLFSNRSPGACLGPRAGRDAASRRESGGLARLRLVRRGMDRDADHRLPPLNRIGHRLGHDLGDRPPRRGVAPDRGRLDRRLRLLPSAVEQEFRQGGSELSAVHDRGSAAGRSVEISPNRPIAKIIKVNVRPRKYFILRPRFSACPRRTRRRGDLFIHCTSLEAKSSEGDRHGIRTISLDALVVCGVCRMAWPLSQDIVGRASENRTARPENQHKGHYRTHSDNDAGTTTGPCVSDRGFREWSSRKLRRIGAHIAPGESIGYYVLTERERRSPGRRTGCDEAPESIDRPVRLGRVEATQLFPPSACRARPGERQ